MFDALSDRFDAIFTRLRGRGRLGETEVDEVLREIRLALLEADVNFKVVKGLVARIKEQCVGADLSKSLTPAQQVIKIVHDELVQTLGGEALKITYASRPPTVVLMAGLQGSGKTTAAAKLARRFKQQGRNPLLVGADLQRPAAVEQLRVLGGQVDVPVFSEATDPVQVARRSVEEAQRLRRDVLIVDTAGRLHVDTEMMDQVRHISEAVHPQYTLEDFLEQMQQVKKMGPLQNLIGMMPGIPKELKKAEIDDRELARIEAIIRSMTPNERRQPSIINGSRRLRIANGSGSTTTE